jgi:hypothetical protein
VPSHSFKSPHNEGIGIKTAARPSFVLTGNQGVLDFSRHPFEGSLFRWPFPAQAPNFDSAMRNIILNCSLALIVSAHTAVCSTEIEVPPKQLPGDPPRVELTLRPVPDVTIESVTAKSGQVSLPAQFKPFRENVDSKVSVAFLIDVSAPAARAAQIKGSMAVVKNLLLAHPESFYEYGIFALGREQLVEIAPTGTASVRAVQMLDAYKPEGETTQGYKLAIQAIEKLVGRSAQRKVVVILSDGKFEDTAYQHADVVKAASESNIRIWGVGLAANEDQSKHLQVLERLANDTKGFYVQADYGTWAISPGFADRFFNFLGGGVLVTIDVAALGRGKVHQIELEIKDADDTFRRVGFEVELGVVLKKEGKKGEKSEGQEKDGGAKKSVPDKPGEDGVKPKTDPVAKGVKDLPTLVKLSQGPALWYVIGGVVALIVLLGVIAALIPRKKEVRGPSGGATSFTPPIAFLEMLDAQSTRYPIRISNVRIGRGRDNDLVLQNDSVSSNHCVLKQSRDGVWTVVDLKSGNGVFVNDQRVEEAILREGDMIELGEVKMRFYSAG